MKLLTKRTTLNLSIILLASGLSLPVFSAGDVDFGTNGADVPSGSNGDGGNGGASSASANTINTDTTNEALSFGDGGGSFNGGLGGSAEATTSTIHTAGNLVADSLARGGNGGEGGLTQGNGGNGGIALLEGVSGSNTGSGEINVIGIATGGDGGNNTSTHRVGGSIGGDGGFARSYFDPFVIDFVSANGGKGADSVLNNKVNGNTSGTLTLEQRAIAGNGGQSFSLPNSLNGNGGSASSSLIGGNPGGGDVVGISYSKAGDFGQYQIGEGGAFSEIVLVGFKDVTATAEAVGGNGKINETLLTESGDGGGAELGRVDGFSAGGGRVEVTGRAVGGDGLSGNEDVTLYGAGASINLNNKVTGDTTGELILRQEAKAGAGGGISNVATGNVPASTYSFFGPGNGGDATSSLLKNTSSDSLHVITESTAGAGGRGLSQYEGTGGPTHTGASGGDAIATSNAINNTGVSMATAIARGGRGGNTEFISSVGPGQGLERKVRGGDGGHATATANAESFGDNNNVESRSEAYGGFAGNENFNLGLVGEEAGEATSTATAVAHGNSNVTVNAQSFGGKVGNDVTDFTGGANIGGFAISIGEGSSQGGNVSVTSFAQGGSSSDFTVVSGEKRQIGGAATATTTATSTTGQVDAYSHAQAGGTEVQGGLAKATSNAS